MEPTEMQAANNYVTRARNHLAQFVATGLVDVSLDTAQAAASVMLMIEAERDALIDEIVAKLEARVLPPLDLPDVDGLPDIPAGNTWPANGLTAAEMCDPNVPLPPPPFDYRQVVNPDRLTRAEIEAQRFAAVDVNDMVSGQRFVPGDYLGPRPRAVVEDENGRQFGLH